MMGTSSWLLLASVRHSPTALHLASWRHAMTEDLVVLWFLSACAFMGLLVVYMVVCKAIGVEGHRRAFVLEHLAALVKRNLPLMAGLEVAALDAGWKLRPKMRRLVTYLKRGRPLSEAMRKCSALFHRQDTELVRAGEVSGNLPKALDLTLANSRFREQTIRSVEYAFAYPFFVLFFGIHVMRLFWLIILPQFKIMWEEILPSPPRGVALFAIRHIEALSTAFDVTAVVITLVMLLWLFREVWIPRLPGIFWELMYFIPFAHRIIFQSTTALFLRELGVQLEVGMPLSKALSLIAEGRIPRFLAKRVNAVCKAVEEGQPLGDSLRRHARLPEDVCTAVTAAERASTLPEILCELADSYSTRLAGAVRTVTNVVTPLLVVGLGVLVAFMVLGTMMPMVEMIARFPIGE